MRKFLKTGVVGIAVAGIAFGGLSWAGVEPVSASHIRGGVGTAVYTVANDGTSTVSISSTLVTQPGAGQNFGSYSLLVFTNQQWVSFTPPASCTRNQATYTTAAVQTSQSSQTIPGVNTLGVVTTTYDSTCWPNGRYLAHADSCCRISLNNASSSSSTSVDFIFDVDGTTSKASPSFNAGFLTNVAYNESLNSLYSLSMNGLAYDGTAVTYTQLTDPSGVTPFGFGASAVPCSDFNNTTGVFRLGVSLCTGANDAAKLASYQASFGGGTKYFAFKVKAEDSTGQAATRDILLTIASSNNNPPVITSNPAPSLLSLVVGTNTPFTYTISATDPDNGDLLNFTTTGLPAWATFTPTNAGTATPTATLVLSPPAGTNAVAQITIGVFDNNVFALSSSLQFDVQVGSAQLPAQNVQGGGQPVAPGAPTLTALQPGLGLLDVEFTAPASNGGAAITNYEYSTDGGTTWVTPNPAVASSPLRITNLVQGGEFTVVLRAVNSVGPGAASNSLTRRTAILPPAPSESTPPSTSPDEAPKPVPAPDGGEVPSPPLGSSIGFENGQPIPVVIENVSVGEWRMTGDGFEMSLEVPGQASTSTGGSGSGGVVTLVRNNLVNVEGTGFSPSSFVDVWLIPQQGQAAQSLRIQAIEPIYLGRVQVGANGSFADGLPVTTAVPTGRSTLQLNGVTKDGVLRSLNLGVQIVEVRPRLPITGSSTPDIVWVALYISLVGLVIMRARRLRRA